MAIEPTTFNTATHALTNWATGIDKFFTSLLELWAWEREREKRVLKTNFVGTSLGSALSAHLSRLTSLGAPLLRLLPLLCLSPLLVHLSCQGIMCMCVCEYVCAVLIVDHKTSYSTKSAICTWEGCPFVWVCSINCLGHAFCSMLSVTCCNLKGQHSLAALVSYPFWLQQAPLSILQKAGSRQLSDHTDKWTPLPRAYNRLSAIISHWPI